MPSPLQKAWAWTHLSFSRHRRLSAKKICGLNGQWKSWNRLARHSKTSCRQFRLKNSKQTKRLQRQNRNWKRFGQSVPKKSNRLACKPCRLSNRPVQNPTLCWKNWTSCEKKKNGRHSQKMLSLQNPAANGDSATCMKPQTHWKKPLQQMLLTSCRER